MPPIPDVMRISDPRKSTKLVARDADDEIVITGISGVFPKSSNVREFGANLLAKKNLISNSGQKYKSGDKYIDYKYGKLGASLTKFDAEFFKMENDVANRVSPMVRMFLEKTFEAILDAGYNPEHFKGSNTAVYVALYSNECGQTWLFEKQTANSVGLMGNMRFSIPNKISHFFGFQGPSYAIDTACTSSLSALENAFADIRNGVCDNAIVGGCNLCLNPSSTAAFSEMGIISKTGTSKCFDESADGFIQAECIAAIFLQKAKDARRVYAKVLHVKTNSNGKHRSSIIFDPSEAGQTDLFQKFYNECGVDPISVNFVEAHATGTKEGDLKEALAIGNVFCVGRNEPLKIGSVKSNMGHSEAASGLCSIAKVIFGFELGIIPPNINFKTPRTDIEALHNGKLTVVTEPTPWTIPILAAVNNFGFGGVNGHLLLSPNLKEKCRGELLIDDLPRLVVASGRDEEAVDIILNDFENRAMDVEYIHLFHQIHVSDISGHGYRGYTLVEKNKQAPVRNIESVMGKEKKPLWFVFSGEGTQWTAMGKSLMALPLFRESIFKCHRVLESKNVNLIEILTDEIRKSTDIYIGITAIQIALYDVLTTIGIQPDGYVGYSVGEIACAYADGCLTLEEAILTSYYRNKALKETKIIHGAVASVDLGREELKNLLPPEIDIACFNGPSNCTISGPSQIVNDFIKTLRSSNIQAENVDVFGIPYHSRYVMESSESLRAHMVKIELQQKLRSKRWICTSNPEVKWNSGEIKYAGTQFYVNNLLNPVYFEGAIRHIPANAIVIEFVPSGLLQKILAEVSGKRTIYIPLLAKSETQNLKFFLRAIGRMFTSGLNPVLHKLYPPLNLPVARGTPMISPLIKWQHTKDWFVPSVFSRIKKSGQQSVVVSLANPKMQYLSGHVIDGRNLYPAAGYLMLVWEQFASMQDMIFSDVSVVFENVKFVRATVIPKDEIEFKILLHKSSGYFEVVERDDAVATGYIHEWKNMEDDLKKNEREPITELPLNSNDVYKEFKLRGYNYQGTFRGITASNYDGSLGRIKWEKNFVSFLDNIFQMSLFDTDWRILFIPTGFKKLIINTEEHFNVLSRCDLEECAELNVHADKEMKSIKCGGIEVQNLNFTSIVRKKSQNEPNTDKVVFVPFVNKRSEDFWEAMSICADVIYRNIPTMNLKILQYVDDFTRKDRNLICEALVEMCQKFPQIQTYTSVTFNKTDHPLKKKTLPPETEINYGELPEDKNKFVLIVANISKQKHMLPAYFNCVEENGFILSVENADDSVSFKGVNICVDQVVEKERFLLLRKMRPVVQPSEVLVVKITEGLFSWLPEVQNYLKALKTDDKLKLILYSQNEQYSGILGLANCLKKEIGVKKIRCISIMDDSAPAFSVDHPFYKSLLRNDLATQVYQNGTWGTYVNIPLEMSTVRVPYAMVNALTIGDLSSLRWMQSRLNPTTFKPSEDTALVHVHYSALNFRNVMVAAGKIPYNTVVKSRLEEEFLQGLEYSGKTTDGQRVMGMVPAKAMATFVEADVHFILPVPDTWTLEEAATVPIVYGTVLYALLLRVRMKEGCSILIHAGSGGVGQAAIYICQYYNCTIFTTVGTPEKRKFIKTTFPNIPDNHIGNSRDTSFERMIKKETNGRGVDIVINSLAGEKLQASVNCLAHGGQFLEIGLYDLVMNNPLGMEHFLKEITFHGIELTSLFHADAEEKRKLTKVLLEFIDRGCIRPLTRTVFSTNELEAAFRFMASGKHIGKVLLKVKDENSVCNDTNRTTFIDAVPRYSCSEDKSYVVCGGLGGMGLELIDWLVVRGARKLVISSRNGVVNGYQNWKIRLWQSYGATVIISTENISQVEGVETLIKIAVGLGPVSAIFNLGAVLHDSLFDNHTEESFAVPFAAKAIATLHLDHVSRRLCPNLEHFVVFSSVTSNYGNIGQSNYGMSNSVMERICEQRKSENLPALAIQFGPVADVGLISTIHVDGPTIGGVNIEPLSTIMEKLHYLLTQPNPVVYCASVAQKHYSSEKKKNIIDIITEMTGIKNIKNINKNATLMDYGLDSMTIVEFSQRCEREFDLFFTAQDLKTFTIGKLFELYESMTRKGDTKSNIHQEIQPEFEEAEASQLHLEITNLVKSLSDLKERNSFIIQLPSSMNEESPTIFLLPGLDGNAKSMESLSARLKARVVGLSYGYDNLSETIQECAARMAKILNPELAVVKEFYVTGYSYGALVAMEMVKILESDGKTGFVSLIDPIPDYAATMRKQFALSGEKIWEDLKIQLVVAILKNFWNEYPETLISRVQSINEWSEVVNYVVSSLPSKYENNKEHVKTCLNVSYFRLRKIIQFEIVPPNVPLRSLTTVINSVKNEFTSEVDNWSQCFSLPVHVRQIESNHFQILNRAETAEIIMKDFIV